MYEPSRLLLMLNWSEQVKWTSVQQESVTFPQGRTTNIVNNSVIYHIMIFHVHPGDLEEEIAVLTVVVFPRVAYG